MFSSIVQILYVEVRISRSISESPLEFEITRVDCILKGYHCSTLSKDHDDGICINFDNCTFQVGGCICTAKRKL